MRFRATFALLGLLLACRGDGRSPEPTNPEPIAGSPGSAGTAQPLPGGLGSAAGSATPAPAPPGSDRLTPVPAEVAAGVKLERVVRGLARPVLVVVAPGDARRRLFVLEQHAGRVRIIDQGKLVARPFLTIPNVSTSNEQGLLGLAFHPGYATNGRFYLNYTDADDHTRIVEYRVSATDPDVADPATRRELAKITQPYSNHNGGHLQFGPDGKLYAGMGDGGSAGDPKGNGQDPDALLAKILRFDVDAAPPVAERVHRGVRNPWRFWFDAVTGDLFIADVGQNLWEYVFVVAGTDHAAKNFGWNVVEGSHCFRGRTCDRTGFTPPAIEYSHDQGCSITGGATYRGKALPQLAGHYFYADFCTGLLRSFRWTPDPASPTSAGFVRDHWDWKAAIDPGAEISQVSSFGVDHDGELYLVELTGAIYKFVPTR